MDVTNTEQAPAQGTECLVHDLFLAQAARTPDQPAVISSRALLTYRDLLFQSRRLAHQLLRLGSGPELPVAVVMEKGPEQIVAVLGVLQSGAPYLPIDPTVPRDRLNYLIQDGGIKTVLTQPWIDSRIDWPSTVHRISVDLDPPSVSEFLPIALNQTPDSLAYVLYTSGSTGSPKGVMVAHRGLVNCILETNRQFCVGASDRVLAVTALHHDMSAFDIFGMLAAGGALVIPDAGGSRAPDHWFDLIHRHGVTIWNSVPAFFQMLLDYADLHHLPAIETLRLAFLGGDWIPLSTPRRAWQRFGRTEVVSVGGPTETTLWNIWYRIGEINPAWKSIPYGRPIANNRYYVLDQDLRDCLNGEAGELWCSGVGLMRGYWCDAERTLAKFSVHPLSGEKIYQTGDRGRLMPDGNIEFLGRNDTQVKILGQRVELGEIEAALTAFPGVRQAAARVIRVAEQPRMAAYVVMDNGVRPDIEALRLHLERHLPCHMVPSALEPIQAFPLTTNGKVNRDALPVPRSWSTPACASVPLPHDPIQQIWQEVLHLEHAGMDHSFFDLGGNSLLLVQVHALLQQRLGVQLPVTALFEFPTIRALRAYLDQRPSSSNDFQSDSDLAGRMEARRRALAQRRSGVSTNA